MRSKAPCELYQNLLQIRENWRISSEDPFVSLAPRDCGINELIMTAKENAIMKYIHTSYTTLARFCCEGHHFLPGWSGE